MPGKPRPWGLGSSAPVRAGERARAHRRRSGDHQQPHGAVRGDLGPGSPQAPLRGADLGRIEILRDAAIAVRDGRVEAVGTTEEIRSTFQGPGAAATGKVGTPGLVDAELAAGKTVFIDFTTEWCTTCAAQKRMINALKGENPAYEQNITFITVDYDDYKGDALTKRLGIPRRSTLVVLKGDDELGRVVAGTSKSQIQGLLDAALSAAAAA